GSTAKCSAKMPLNFSQLFPSNRLPLWLVRAGQILVEAAVIVLNWQTAVNAQDLAGNVPGLRRGEKNDRRGHVSGGAEPRNGGGVPCPFQELGREPAGELGFDESRSHGVDGDIPRSDLLGQGLREADQTRLRRAVVGL